MSHFKVLQSREDFVLSEGAKVPGSITQYLRGFQLEAVKFIADHLLKGQSCILNDQEGLGKTAVVVAFFSAVRNKRVVLIVNNESNVLHWQYHFEKLARISVGTIDDEEGTSNKETIQLIRWGTLISNPRIVQKFKSSDQLVLDNRGSGGGCLSNKICESFLLKNFDGRINLIVSSADLTSDLETLWTSLKLVGRLEKKYEKRQVFLDKFSFPENSEKSLDKDFLEKYFVLRNVIRDYCGSYRLRRYTHQFLSFLPLTNKSDYEKHFQNWLGIGSSLMIGNNSSQESSKLASSSSSASTNELFETLYLAPKTQDIGQNAQSFENLGTEEEIMPPLMFEDDSDTDQQSLKLESKNPTDSSMKKEKETTLTLTKKTSDKTSPVSAEKKKKIKINRLAKMLEIDFTSKYQINKSILKKVSSVKTETDDVKPSKEKSKGKVVKKEKKRLLPVKMLLPKREPKLKGKPVNKQLEKLKKLLDIDFTPKHQINKKTLDEVFKLESDMQVDKKAEKKNIKKKTARAEKLKKQVKEYHESRTNLKQREIQKKKSNEKTPDQLRRRERLEKLLEIDFTPKYQLNNIRKKTINVPTKRDLKKPNPIERIKSEHSNTQKSIQNAQKYVESASPDTTTQESPKNIMDSQDSIKLDIDREIKKLTEFADTETSSDVVEEPQKADVIVVSDSDDSGEDANSPDIFGGTLEDFITDDESIDCSQTAPLPPLKEKAHVITKKKTAQSKQSCLQHLESQDLSSEGHNNYMDVYSEFLQAQKSNETSPAKSTINNSKPVTTGNKITKYFGGGTSSAIQIREILKTPARRKSFCAIRKSPKTPPNIQNNNIMTWLVRSSTDHQDSSITSSSKDKDIKRRRLDY